MTSQIDEPLMNRGYPRHSKVGTLTCKNGHERVGTLPSQNYHRTITGDTDDANKQTKDTHKKPSPFELFRALSSSMSIHGYVNGSKRATDDADEREREDTRDTRSPACGHFDMQERSRAIIQEIPQTLPQTPSDVWALCRALCPPRTITGDTVWAL